MNAAAHDRIYTVCREATREMIMKVVADSDYDARSVASRMTGWPFDALTTKVKPVEVIHG